jgi:tRNA modification GTPase
VIKADTIYALSSGYGRAGVAVIRLSGSLAFDVARQMGATHLTPRHARLVKLLHPGTAVLLDRALVVPFAAPASFTGEDVVEFHVHGGRALVAAVLSALKSVPGLRPARPGEFTERAFEYGKLDLTQVEALSELIDSDTEQQRLQALQGLEGDLGRSVAGWKEQLLTLRAVIAAQIDFADEGDVPEGDDPLIDSLLQRLQDDFDSALRAFASRRVISEGLRVVIVGQPNVGKSTLLNTLAGTDVAIVTDMPGTTRDVIEVKLDLGGYAVVLADTAGLRDAVDPVEKIGIERTYAALHRAHCVLFLDEVGAPLSPEIEHPHLIRVRTKCDQPSSATSRSGDVLDLSSHTGFGLDLLRARLQGLAMELSQTMDAPVVLRERQAVAILAARASIAQARESAHLGIEIVDQSVRAALHALGRVIGEIDVEDVLGGIFSRFCIGK